MSKMLTRSLKVSAQEVQAESYCVVISSTKMRACLYFADWPVHSS